MEQKDIDKITKESGIETVTNGQVWYATKMIFGPINTVSLSISGPTEEFTVLAVQKVLESGILDSGVLPEPEFVPTVPQDKKEES